LFNLIDKCAGGEAPARFKSVVFWIAQATLINDFFRLFAKVLLAPRFLSFSTY